MSDAYPWLVTLGALASLLWLGLVEESPKQFKTLFQPISRIDAGLSTLVGGFLGARLAFVLMHMHYFSSHPNEIMNYWNGGLSWAGGAIGALLGLGIYAALTKKPFWLLADFLALPAALFAFSAWFGCLLDGCAYGEQANFGFLTPLTPNNLGIQLTRWPVQGSGAILALGTFLFLNKFRLNNPPAGMLATLSLTLISGSNLLLSFFRGDQVPAIHGFRSDALASAVLMILGLLALAMRARKWNQQ